MRNTTDRCKGCRAAYNALLRALATNNMIAILVAGLPIYILISLSASHLLYNYSVYMSAAYTILTVLIIAWVVASISAIRIYPNLLSFSIFLYKCIAHWSLVSMTLVAFYGSYYLSMSIIGPLIATWFPLIATLFMCGDLLVRVRQRLFNTIEAAVQRSAAATAATAPIIETGEAKEPHV